MLTAKQKVDLVNLYAKLSDNKIVTNQESLELINFVEAIIDEERNKAWEEINQLQFSHTDSCCINALEEAKDLFNDY